MINIKQKSINVIVDTKFLITEKTMIPKLKVHFIIKFSR